MVVNGKELLVAAPIKNMLTEKRRGADGVSYGLAEVGYDIRLKQTIHMYPANISFGTPAMVVIEGERRFGNFIIASAIEEFDMPDNLVGIVHDKSTWARRGLSVFNTVIEPSWKGFLTLELVYHGYDKLVLPAGTGIAQVIFHSIAEPTKYEGSYQNQPDRPVPSLTEK
jgi:dCTP deaminase